MKAEVLIEPENNQIYLSDFVENPELLRALGKDSIIFGYSPMPGRTMKVSLAYVIGKFQRYLEDATYVRPEADIVLVYRKASTPLSDPATDVELVFGSEGNDSVSQYDEVRLKKMCLMALEEKLEVDFDDKIEIFYDTFPPTPFKGTIESIKVYSRGSAKFMLRIEYLTEEGSKRYESIDLRAKWPVQGLKTNKQLRKDVLLSQEYLTVQAIDYFDYNDPVLISESTDDYVARFTLGEDQILEWRMLKKRAYVLKGQVISAVVQLSGVTVASKVEMLENGEIGQLVRAKNIDTGVMITGILYEGPVLQVSY